MLSFHVLAGIQNAEYQSTIQNVGILRFLFLAFLSANLERRCHTCGDNGDQPKVGTFIEICKCRYTIHALPQEVNF